VPGSDSFYGYGLTLTERHGVRLVEHGGSRSGYGSTIMMAPARHAGVIVLGNRTGSGLPKTAERALEFLLGLPAGSLGGPSAHGNGATSPVDMSPWIGRYSQGGDSALEIAVKDGHVVCRDGTRELPAAPSGDLRLTVGNAAGGQPTTWVLVPDRDGKPAYVFRGGRAFKRVALE
jgi:hypothetical protein